MGDLQPNADFLIEISYEVANFNGGVYTVMTTKSREMQKYYGQNYYVIGPYYHRSASVEFEEQMPPDYFRPVLQKLKKKGITCHYGRWLVPGNPKTFLIDFSKRLKFLDEIKKRAKDAYGIDCFTGVNALEQRNIHSPHVDTTDLNLQLAWGDAVRDLVKGLLNSDYFREKHGVLHFHFSDPTAMLVAELKKSNSNVALVATAHSTRLGRAIVMHGENLAGELQNAGKGSTIDPGREYKYGGRNITIHHLEQLLVRNVDVLTAVSSVLVPELKYVLGREPDVITPNGINLSQTSSLKEHTFISNMVKNKLYRFLNAYFSPYYNLELTKPVLFFTAGRYEVRTKGYELFFDALGKLNQRLKTEGFNNNIFVFLFIMMNRKEVDESVLTNLALYDAIEHQVEKYFPSIKNRLVSSLLHGRATSHESLFDEDFFMNTSKLTRKFRQQRGVRPPVRAFKGMKKDDYLVQSLKTAQLMNREDDKVKVIFYPAPVSMADSLLSMDYAYAVSGMHLGVFPSLYEPWGYTPLETTVQGVPSITSDVSGFGRFVLEKTGKEASPAIGMVKTAGKSRSQIVNDLTDMMHTNAVMPEEEREKKKLQLRDVSTLLDWKEMAKNHISAHNMAIERCKKRRLAGEVHPDSLSLTLQNP